MSVKSIKKSLHGTLGKTVIAEGDVKVRIKDIVHSFKHVNKAVLNGEHFINYLELMCQVHEHRRPSKDELDEFNKIVSKERSRKGFAGPASKNN